MYTIGQVSEMFGLPISTLRYYDKQGLFPEMERVSGIRKFSASTYSQRKALFEKQRETLEAEIAHMNQVLDMLKFKCWYYGQASQDGSEDRVRSMIPNGLPEDVRKAYENAHHD